MTKKSADRHQRDFARRQVKAAMGERNKLVTQVCTLQTDLARHDSVFKVLSTQLPTVARMIEEGIPGAALMQLKWLIDERARPTHEELKAEVEKPTNLRRAMAADLFDALAHGSPEHQDWLNRALQAWVVGDPIPEVVQ